MTHNVLSQTRELLIGLILTLDALLSCIYARQTWETTRLLVTPIDCSVPGRVGVRWTWRPMELLVSTWRDQPRDSNQPWMSNYTLYVQLTSKFGDNPLNETQLNRERHTYILLLVKKHIQISNEQRAMDSVEMPPRFLSI